METWKVTIKFERDNCPYFVHDLMEEDRELDEDGYCDSEAAPPGKKFCNRDSCPYRNNVAVIEIKFSDGSRDIVDISDTTSDVLAFFCQELVEGAVGECMIMTKKEMSDGEVERIMTGFEG